MADRVGQQFGNYRLVRFIKSGAFGDVYLGEHVSRKTQAAVKVLKTKVASDNVKDFLNEARTIRLRHPHIIEVLDFGVEGDIPFLIMTYVPNGSLRDQHPQGSQLPLPLVVSYTKQVAEALPGARLMRP